MQLDYEQLHDVADELAATRAVLGEERATAEARGRDALAAVERADAMEAQLSLLRSAVEAGHMRLEEALEAALVLSQVCGLSACMPGL